MSGMRGLVRGLGLMLGLGLVLAGCGADGPPVAPQAGGVTVSGEARLGVTGGTR